ncbi:galactokinase [Actinoplanes bogorensis]|uniref:Galactokinase n=1 Tax=Paractinoplanes bogorensis TaxID=1610840 RepID=A0ABS5YJS2_9ACTN|nr:galactokinase [Actinoplanes bogorensis]MBU2662959.1 galactokinase [Actinoplanes bogorensis]
MNAHEAFVKEYGVEPAGLWAAPGRVNLIGEHTDYNDGFVLPFALPQRTVAAVGPAPDDSFTVCSTFETDKVTFGFDTQPGEVTGWAAYVAGIVWSLRDKGFEVPAVRIAIDSEVPLGSGLSSSAALESSVLTALIDLGGLDVPVEQRPVIAQRAENVYVGAPTGILDQSASIRCREGHALFLDCRSYEVEQIPFDLAGQGLAILVINSNAPHQHVDGEYGARRKSCEEAARILGVPALRDISGAELDDALARLDDDVMRRRVRHIVTEDDRVLETVTLLKAGQVREIGPLLTASHASMRDDFEITVPQVDIAVETALAVGAYGARMTGGGFGGCVLALIDADKADVVTAAVEEAYAEKGFTAPTAWTVTAGPGATKL